jgi:hypothetical protein
MRNNLFAPNNWPLTQQERQWAEQYWFAEEQTFGASTPKVRSKHQHQPALLISKDGPAWLLRGHFPTSNAGKVSTNYSKYYRIFKSSTFQHLNDFGVIFLHPCVNLVKIQHTILLIKSTPHKCNNNNRSLDNHDGTSSVYHSIPTGLLMSLYFKIKIYIYRTANKIGQNCFCHRHRRLLHVLPLLSLSWTALFEGPTTLLWCTAHGCQQPKTTRKHQQ